MLVRELLCSRNQHSSGQAWGALLALEAAWAWLLSELPPPHRAKSDTKHHPHPCRELLGTETCTLIVLFSKSSFCKPPEAQRGSRVNTLGLKSQSSAQL